MMDFEKEANELYDLPDERAGKVYAIKVALMDAARQGQDRAEGIALNAARDLLQCLMREISEDHYCASWMMGLEYALWKIAVNSGGEYGNDMVDSATAQRLRELAEISNGWWAWPEEEKDGEIFIPLDEWKKMYAEKRKR